MFMFLSAINLLSLQEDEEMFVEDWVSGPSCGREGEELAFAESQFSRDSTRQYPLLQHCVQYR